MGDFLKSLWSYFSKSAKDKNLELVCKILTERDRWIADNAADDTYERFRYTWSTWRFDKPYIAELRKINENYGVDMSDEMYRGKYFSDVVGSGYKKYPHLERNDAYDVLVNEVIHRYYSKFQEFRVAYSNYVDAVEKAKNAAVIDPETNLYTMDSPEPFKFPVDDNSIKNRAKRSVTPEDELVEQSVSASENDNQTINEPLNTETPNSTLPATMVPVTVMISSAITTAFTASNIKALYDEKQGNSTLGTAVRASVQIGVPSVVGSVPVVIAATTGAVSALPVTIAVAATAAGVASICGGITLGVTLYYNKFFVAQKLRHLEESFKKMPTSDLTLAQKKSLMGLINHSLSILKGDMKKGIEKSSKKIKKLNPQILFNLSKIEEIISELATSARQSKEGQKRSKKMHKYINELLEHSILFSLLINDMKHIKKTYELLNLIKKRVQVNKNPDIQNILAKINRNNLLKIAKYNDLLERFKAEQDYAASTKGKLRAASKAVVSFLPEKKEFVQLHEKVIHLASEINDDYQELKEIVGQFQKHSDKFKSERSKQQVLDIYTAYKPLSYREAIEKNQEYDSNDFESMDESRRLLRA